jgi:ComF family protein
MQLPGKIFMDTMQLFYPHVCAGCNSDILPQQNLLCATCLHILPVTGFAAQKDNPVEKIFWGRVPVQAAFAHLYFTKGVLVQQLMHQLKYQANTAVGFFLGELMGKAITAANRFATIDALIPLPLYAAKERKRGYNQAAIICNGMAEVLQVPVINQQLVRCSYTGTQTNKHRVERWQNVAGSFAIQNAAALQGKHLLLVDDVLTTGATLEAAASMLLQIPSVTVSIATAAVASK